MTYLQADQHNCCLVQGPAQHAGPTRSSPRWLVVQSRSC